MGFHEYAPMYGSTGYSSHKMTSYTGHIFILFLIDV
jgi:hypothetical protein